MRPLVVGADSRIGGHLFYYLAERYPVIGTSRRSLTHFYPFDLLYAGRELPRAPITYFCAAVNGFSTCEDHPEYARTVNVTNTLESATKQVGAGSRVVFLSSCAAETSQKVYGQLKLETERGFLEFGDDAAIFRFGPVLFSGRKAYPDGAYQPIAPHDLVKRLAGLIKEWEPGLHRLLS